MSQYRKDLPPLDNLLFFHAAANNPSLSSAAQELFVTQAAVSKRIQRFEDWLGTPLFSRDNNSLQITETGKVLAADVEIALDFLKLAIAKVQTPGEPVVRIAANETSSMFWLHTQLREFSLSDSSCNVNVVTTENTAELLSDQNDLAVLFCDGDVPGWETTKLLGGELMPAASPEIAQKAEALAMFDSGIPAQNAPALLEFPILTPDWINWQRWLEQKRFAKASSWHTIACHSYMHSVGKAIKGEGILLAYSDLLDSEFRSGKLVRIGNAELTPRKSYFLCCRANAQLSPSAKQLWNFLTNVTGIRSSGNSSPGIE
jgi:LysR family glycine cleavage system transcriptional activator